MSTYEPGRLYLIDLDGETHQATYRQGGRDNHAAVFLTYDGAVISALKAQNPRLAVALDPEDEDVRAVLRRGEYVRWHAGDPDGYVIRLADKIRAQITPPEPPMKEPTEWGTVVQTDEGRAILLDPDNDAAALTWFIEGRGWAGWLNLKNPRLYENPREKPATGAERDAQGSVGGIGRVSDSEAGERL